MSEFVTIANLLNLADVDPVDILDHALPPVIWNMYTPPEIDTDRIILNVSAVQRYHRVGAMSSSIVIEHQGDRTEFTPGVSGINPDGSAIATRAGVVQKADKSRTACLDPLDIPPSVRHIFGKPIVVHSLNKPEMAQNISSLVRSGKSREAAWANQLDAGLRDSFRRAGKEHLMNRQPKLFNHLDYSLFGIWGGSIANDTLSGHATAFNAILWTSIQAAFTGWEAVNLKRLTGSTHIDQKRWSLFFSGQQSDRYVALYGLSRVSRLITVRE